MAHKSGDTDQALIIDCQVFQSSAWHRGMGKYSRSLLTGMLEKTALTDAYKPYFLFNRSLDKNQEAVDLITQSYPEAEFIYLDLELPKEPREDFSIQPTITQNKVILNQLIDGRFNPQTTSFLILALYLDEVCCAFPDRVADKLLVYYDAIPYLYHERYAQFIGFFQNFYMPHTVTVYEASKILTISKTVANDLHVMFGLPEERIFAIDGASIPREAAPPSEPDSLDGVSGDFILLATGQELRKNNARAVRAFEQFRAQNELDTKLVITSHFSDEGQQELRALSDHVVFAGNVSEGEMLWIYQNCQFVFFPSEYEGLGLPILEAVEQDKPIACSDISVFREMSTAAFTFFDPLDIDSIAEALGKVAADKRSKQTIREAYEELTVKYTWKRSAKLLLEALRAEPQPLNVKKKKVAIFCPEPSGFSAIGKVLTESHAWYSRYFDITYYFDKGPNHHSIRTDLLWYLAPSYDIEQFKPEDRDKYDALIYHIGNSEYHLNIIHTALAFPGYVILHDTYLNGAYANLISQGYMTSERLEAEKKLDALLPDKDKSGKPKSAKLSSIVNNQLAVITHSDYASQAVEHKLVSKQTVVRKVNLPVDTPIFEDIVHGLTGRLNIAFAGIIAKVKGTDVIERIALSPDFANCNINIFGYSAVEPERLEELKTLPHVKLVTNPNDYEFQKLMADTDIIVNVRLAYTGETSLTTLEAMRYGVAVLVRDFGWYSELPDDAVVKVDNPDSALPALLRLVQNPKKLQQIKQKAFQHTREHFSREAYAKTMYQLINGDKSD